MSWATRRGVSRRVLALGAALGAALTLTGCLDLDASVTVDDDRSATLVIDAYPDSDALLEFGGEEALDTFISNAEQVADGNGLRIEKLEDRRVPGVRLTIEDIPDAAQLAQPVSVPNGPALQPFNRFDLSEDDSGWTLDAELVPLSSLLQLFGPLGEMQEDLDRIDYTVRITLPGRVVSTNASERDGSTAIWTVDAADPAPWRLSMQTDTSFWLPEEGLLIGGIVLVVLVGIALVVTGDRWRVRRKQRRALKTSAPAATWAANPTNLPSAPGTPPSPGGPATPAPGRGMYSDLTGDTSVALPVGGASWGPPPPPVAPPTTTPPAPVDTPPPFSAPTTASPEPAAAPEPVEPTQSSPPTSPSPPTQPPPEPPKVQVVPPGWYPDPDDPQRSRFWDGAHWTDHTA